tara:strand:- start:2983 stop:3573 length:591 start_codon:yes stop_codon:yes gene_type:complete
MTPITNNLLNNTTTDYNIFILIKRNMINGETSISNLSSKNRALLHRICADFGLEHYSTGNYNNRVFVIKDSQHTYFTQTLNDDYWENYLNNEIESNQINSNNNDLNNDDSNYSDSGNDEDEDEDEEEDEVDEEKDTDTYSSDSESTNSDSTGSISNSEYNSLYLINKINYQGKILKYIYILSLGNLILNTYLMFSN